jgi:hypothetical protein
MDDHHFGYSQIWQGKKKKNKKQKLRAQPISFTRVLK